MHEPCHNQRRNSALFRAQSQVLRYDKLGTTPGKYAALKPILSGDGPQRTSYMAGTSSHVICSARSMRSRADGHGQRPKNVRFNTFRQAVRGLANVRPGMACEVRPTNSQRESNAETGMAAGEIGRLVSVLEKRKKRLPGLSWGLGSGLLHPNHGGPQFIKLLSQARFAGEQFCLFPGFIQC